MLKLNDESNRLRPFMRATIFLLAACTLLLAAGCKSHKHKSEAAGAGAPPTAEEAAASIDKLKKRTEKDPSDIKSWTKLANAYARQKNYDAALDAYRNAIKIEPDQGKLYARAAEAAQDGKHNDLATQVAKEGLARKAVADDPEFGPQLKKVLAGGSIAGSSETTTSPGKLIDHKTSSSAEKGGAGPAKSAAGGGVAESTGATSDSKAAVPAMNPDYGKNSSPCEELPHGQLSEEQLQKLVPEGSEGRVFIRWRTESQQENYGFNIFRATAAGGPWTKVNHEIIGGEGSTNIPKDYCYEDKPLPRGGVFFYKIQSISMTGVTEDMEGTVGTRVQVKTIAEEREWLKKKALGIDTATSRTHEASAKSSAGVFKLSPVTTHTI